MRRAYRVWLAGAGGVISVSVAAMVVSAGAQQPPAPPQAYQTMLNDYRALEGSMLSMTGSLDHFKVSLQAALDQMVKEHQKSEADLKASDDRLAWVLNNWVKPAGKP